MLTRRELSLLVLPSTRFPSTTEVVPLKVTSVCVQVHIGPAQMQQLSTTCPSVGGKPVEGEQAMRPRMLEERRKLRRRPDPSRFRAAGTRALRLRRRVRGEKPLDVYGIGERFAQGVVYVRHCGRRQRRPSRPPLSARSR